VLDPLAEDLGDLGDLGLDCELLLTLSIYQLLYLFLFLEDQGHLGFLRLVNLKHLRLVVDESLLLGTQLLLGAADVTH
jgi:hypothetical protein